MRQNTLKPKELFGYQFFFLYSIPPILRGFWDEKNTHEKPRNWGGRVKWGHHFRSQNQHVHISHTHGNGKGY